MQPDAQRIPERERERVFERFYRLAETPSQEGSGLGLAIVREIATSCGAQVRMLDRAARAEGLLVRVAFPSHQLACTNSPT